MLKRIYNFSKLTISASPYFFVLNLIILFVFAFSNLGASYAFKLATDSMLQSQESGVFSFNVVWAILFFFLMICIGGNTYNFNSMVVNLYTFKAKKIFSKLFIYKSYTEKQDSFYNNDFYDNYTFVKNNIGSTTQISEIIFNRFLSAVISFVVTSVAITIFNPSIFIFIIIMSTVMIIVNRYIVKKRYNLNRDYIAYERRAEYYSQLLSSSEHSKELRVNRLQKTIHSKWEAAFDVFSTGRYKFEKMAISLSSITDLTRIILSNALRLYNLYLVMNRVISISDFVFLNSIMWTLSYSVLEIIDIFSNDFSQSYKYVSKYEDFVGNTNHKSIDKTLDNCDSDPDQTPLNFEKLTLKNVSYSYPNQEGNSVNNIDLCITKGEVVSLLGYNGSGKSTLSKLICGILEDYEGTIKLNETDLKSIQREELYKYFGVGFQDFTKYSLTLRENIGFGMIEKIDDTDEIQIAADKGNISEIYENLPNGLDTVIGKEYDSTGQELSGGQWQRIILSRAYMGEPEFLILDEPTASIDPIEEIRMLNHFKELINGKTALLISHRIGFARLATRICIMENGSIVEDGTHEQLLALRGRYYEMFVTQQKLYAKKEGV